MCKFIKHFRQNRLRKKHDNKLKSASNLETKIINSVFDEYMDEDERQRLVSEARTCCYSEDKLKNIEESFNSFTIDKVTYNVANEIIDAQNHVKQHKKESFLSMIANVVPIDDEEDDE